jgi:hypothetical protein
LHHVYCTDNSTNTDKHATQAGRNASSTNAYPHSHPYGYPDSHCYPDSHQDRHARRYSDIDSPAEPYPVFHSDSHYRRYAHACYYPDPGILPDSHARGYTYPRCDADYLSHLYTQHAS